jgi:hypothetical protein
MIEERHIKWILKEAKRRGLVIRKAPKHYKFPGKRIGGSKRKFGQDRWMGKANVALYKWQLAKEGKK